MPYVHRFMQMLEQQHKNISECTKTISNTTTVVNRGGSKYWYVEDKLHREDGPAVEHLDGHREWYIDGLLHRVNGPAIEHIDGHKEYYIKGKYLNKKDFDDFVRLNIMLKLI